ncbi:MAG: protoporphyrinogen/coproporphyrinogen oxidase [Actinomycetota bacterium]|nr:protoporphyrinogen/coproporphyrinogen oxidase [Actinomycetota bacterium]
MPAEVAGGRPHVVVVGGGITGLATAWFLRDRARVTVLEADGRLGGKIRTSSLGGVPVEEGPDTFLARVPHAWALAAALEVETVTPATGKAFVWTRGQLRRLPEGQVLGVPVELGPLLRSGVLPPAAVARAGLDLVLPRRRPGLSADPSVAEVIGSRMGQGVVDRLVEPLVGGINAGRADDLSLAATAPQLAEAAAGSRSLILGLRRRRPAPSITAGPLFLGIAGGLGRLVDRLAAGLAEAGVEICTDTAVTAIEADGTGGGYRVVTADGMTRAAAAVVVTVPAFAAGPMLKAAVPAVAADLQRIRYASVAVSTLAYRPEDVTSPLDGAGFLVPRVDRRLMTACTWSTSKWPALAESGLVLVRASAGRSGDDRFADLADDELVDHLHRELAAVIGVRRPPVTSLVSRWPRGFPQYQPGHQRRVDRIEAGLAAALPGVVVAGAAYRGLGIAACVRQAEEAADATAARLATV